MATASEGQGTEADEEQTTAQDEKPTDSAQGTADSGEQEQTAPSEDGDEDSEDENEGVASGRSIASPIEDVSSLPGETISDQDGRNIGEVKEIYGVGDDETPMWVTIKSSTGLGRHRMVFVPLARIKSQNDEIRVPYSFDHIHESPEVEAGDEISEEDDHALRVYYAIGLADQELVQSARSYASQVPEEEEGEASKVDGDAAEGPVREIDDTPPGKRAAEAYEKQKEEEGEEHRKGKDTTADEIFQEDGGDDEKKSGDEEPKGEEKQSDSEEDDDQNEKDGED